MDAAEKTIGRSEFAETKQSTSPEQMDNFG